MDYFDYKKKPYTVPEILSKVNKSIWNYLSSSGSWWTSKEKTAIAEEVRNSYTCDFCRERKKSISPYGLKGTHQNSKFLSATIVDLVHRIATDSGRITEKYVKGLSEEGITDGHYIELLSVVVFVLNIDTMHKGAGIPLEKLPDPKDDKISRYKPKNLVYGEAWVPMLPVKLKKSSPEYDLYGDIKKPTNVLRALSMVPDAARCQNLMEGNYYLEPHQVVDLHNNGGKQISRPQIELIASRVSTNNECFYCSSSHTLLLDQVSDANVKSANKELLKNKNPNVDTNSTVDELLVAFTDSLMNEDEEPLRNIRGKIQNRLGQIAVAEISGVVGSFQRMNRIANATGIPLDKIVNAMSGDIQEELGLKEFKSSETTQKSNPISAFIFKKFRKSIFEIASKLSSKP